MSKPNLLLWIEDNQRIADTPGGELADNWVRIGQEWFEALTLGGSEQQTQGNSDGLATHKLTSIWRSGMHPRLRLTYGDDPNAPARTFGVQSVVNVNEQNRKLLWNVTEIV